MKKLILLIFTLCCIVTCIQPKIAKANDFAGNEEKYINLCSSKKLTNSQQETCKKFNTYLKNKTTSLKNELKTEKQELNKTNNNIKEVNKKIDAVTNQITATQTEIQYLEDSISSLNEEINKQTQNNYDRLYSLQSLYNSHTIDYFIFGSSSFSDFFSRSASMNTLTQYDKEVMQELAQKLTTLDSQKEVLDIAKKNLEIQKSTADALKKQLNQTAQQQSNNINSIQKEQNQISEAQKKIDENLTRLYLESLKENSSTGIGQLSGSSLGVKIANKALTRQGCRYWWGAPGGGFGDGQGLDNAYAKYFDCSGLVAWAHRQSGVRIGRTTASGYSKSGKSVTYNNLQIGDVITFSYGGGVAHIGIYIGKINGKRSFVHASGGGSQTRGQYADQCVKVNSIEPGTYWYKYIYNCRRLY